MPEKFEGKTMHEDSMEYVLKTAEEKAEKGEDTFEHAFITLLMADGYVGEMNPELKEAVEKRDIGEMVRIAHGDGWL